MSENEKTLAEALSKINAFHAEREPERLREAAFKLTNVSLKREFDAGERLRIRGKTLEVWLNILAVLDRETDASFDPAKVPPKSVAPPPTSEGVVYPPNADPKLIDDPLARAEYEKALAQNKTNQERYRMQTHLRRLRDTIPPRADEFIRASFSAKDKDELNAAVEKAIENPQTRTRLMALIAPSS